MKRQSYVHRERLITTVDSLRPRDIIDAIQSRLREICPTGSLPTNAPRFQLRELVIIFGIYCVRPFNALFVDLTR